MPSERFFKLAKEKQERILRAGFHEFCRVSVADASINSIIREADISRGSFYTYFEDKMDLLRYIMTKFMKQYEDSVLDFLRQSGGDIFLCARMLYGHCHREFRTEDGLRFMRNIFSDAELMQEMTQSCDAGGCNEMQRRGRAFCARVYQELDHRNYSVDEEQLMYLLPMVFTSTIRCAAIAANCPERVEEVQRNLRHELEILKYGVLRREDREVAEQ